MALRVSNVRITLTRDKEPVMAYVDFLVEDCLLIREVKVIRSSGCYFVSMPPKKLKNGIHMDTVAPINNETRNLIEDSILTEFERITGETVTRRVRRND